MNKINKPTAKKLFMEGVEIIVCMDKTNPLSMFASRIQKGRYECNDLADFEKFLNSFHYYNSNSELGRRICYYVESRS